MSRERRSGRRARSARTLRFEPLEPRLVLSSVIGSFDNGMWRLDATNDDQWNGGRNGDVELAFGMPGDVPVAGDWNGDGVEEFAIFRDGKWFFDLDGMAGAGEKAFVFGVPGDRPVAGDFNGDGRTDAAIFRDGLWFFDLDGAGGVPEAARVFGAPGDVPVVGDWNGDGVDDVGVFRNGRWFLDTDDAGGAAEKMLTFGVAGDQPVTGDWNADGRDEVAVKRGANWYLDLDGAGGFGERAFQFGPVAGVPVSVVRHSLFVSPSGSAGAMGTRTDPLSFAAAISANSPARPGDTVWMLGGTYKGTFTSVVSGTASAPLTVRALPGKRPTIDGSITIEKQGAWSRFWGLEVTSSQTKRVSADTGPFPTDIQVATGVNVYAPHSALINMAIHDIVGNGIGVWKSAVNAQLYGNLVYNNGWSAPDHGHGHGIYAQNDVGWQFFRDNIVFQNLGGGIDPHGSGVLGGWHMEGNTVFRNSIGIGYFDTMHSIHLYANRTYDGTIRTLLNSGSTDVIIQGNYSSENMQLEVGQDLLYTGNRSAGIKLTAPSGVPLGNYRVDRNTYAGGPVNFTNSASITADNFAQWQALSFDPAGNYVGAFAGVDVFVTPNAYEAGRGHVVVYNWALKNSVQADVSSILKPGDRYEVRDAQNYFGAPVATGTYQGGKIALPMNLTAVAGRNGNLGTPAHTSAEYNAFVVVRVP